MLGIALHLLGTILRFMPLLALVYAFGFGLVETLGLALQAPGFTWQVPAQWVRGSSGVRALVWGIWLGPGLVTRNPYAGMWLLLFLLALSQNLLTALGTGMAIGITHGGARALGVLSNRKCHTDPAAPLLILAGVWRWKYFDGLALLLVAGALAAYVLPWLSSHM